MLTRRSLWALAASLTGALRAQQNQATEIKTDHLKRRIDQREKMFFLDVREPKELEELGTLKGYVNIPMSQLQARMKEIPRDRLVVAY